MCFGRGRLVEDDESEAVRLHGYDLAVFSRAHSGTDYAIAPKSHLDATPVIEIVIEEMSAKMREGGPKGPHDADEVRREPAGWWNCGECR